MRAKLVIRLAGAAALAAVCVQASGATPPALVAKRAEAQRVLAEISAIDEQLNTVSEQFDGARVRLTALRHNLKLEQVALGRAQVRYAAAQKRAAALLVYLYKSDHSSAMDVILGATSVSELFDLSAAEDAISKQTAGIADEASQARKELQLRVKALAADRAAAQATVHELAQRRAEVMHGLAQRRRLLATVQTQVSKLEAQERARQARLAAEARARLAAEAAARARAEAKAKAQAEARARAEAAARAQAAARAKAAAAAAAQARAASSATPPPAATTTTEAPAALPAAGATGPTGTVESTDSPAPAVTPAASASTAPFVTTDQAPVTLPAGHPQAATIALQYLGIPYLWGGSSPSGFDCSGLVTYVFAQLGVTLPHFAADQWGFGVPVPTDQLQAGDLVFFDGLDHVGIYIGNSEFINAPHTGSLVRIDSLNEPWYSSHYVGARRVLIPAAPALRPRRLTSHPAAGAKTIRRAQRVPPFKGGNKHTNGGSGCVIQFFTQSTGARSRGDRPGGDRRHGRRRCDWLEDLQRSESRLRRLAHGRRDRSGARQRLGSLGRAHHSVVDLGQRLQLLDALQRRRDEVAPQRLGPGRPDGNDLQRKRERLRDQLGQRERRIEVPLRHRGGHDPRAGRPPSTGRPRFPASTTRRPGPSTRA